MHSLRKYGTVFYRGGQSIIHTRVEDPEIWKGRVANSLRMLNTEKKTSSVSFVMKGVVVIELGGVDEQLVLRMKRGDGE